MKKNLGIEIIELLSIIFTISSFFAIIDYLRITNAEEPMFCRKEYDDNSKKEIYTSLLYTGERTVRKDNNEPLYNSKNIKYNLFGIFEIKTIDKYIESDYDNKLLLTETENCANQSELYFADENIKVYTYCLDKIEIGESGKTLLEELKTNSIKLVNELERKLLLAQYSSDIVKYESNSSAISNTGIVLFQCTKDNINDVYIGKQGIIQQPDFCTYKDDDFKFIAKIIEEDHDPIAEENKKPEIFYEDSEYRYEFSEPKSNYIYLETPEVRGKLSQKIPLTTVLNNNLLTIEELEEKGLEFNKIAKNQ